MPRSGATLVLSKPHPTNISTVYAASCSAKPYTYESCNVISYSSTHQGPFLETLPLPLPATAYCTSGTSFLSSHLQTSFTSQHLNLQQPTPEPQHQPCQPCWRCQVPFLHPEHSPAVSPKIVSRSRSNRDRHAETSDPASATLPR
jgi:hypothetical protein